MHKIVRRRVLGMIGHHGANDGHVVHAGGQIWKQLAHVGSTLAVLPELVGRRQDLVADIENSGRRLERDCLSVFSFEPGLGIEGVDLRRPAIHEQKNDGPGFRLIVWKARGQGVPLGEGGRGGDFIRDEVREGQASEAVGALAQHLSSAHSRPREINSVHVFDFGLWIADSHDR